MLADFVDLYRKLSCGGYYDGSDLMRPQRLPAPSCTKKEVVSAQTSSKLRDTRTDESTTGEKRNTPKKQLVNRDHEGQGFSRAGA